jgi:ubiquinone/menaquinone biosynthesis methyltransferase
VPRLRTAFDSPEQKRRYVRSLFATIADRYDFITVFLSFGRDRSWKRRLVREALLAKGERVVDLACGTGDIAFEAMRSGASVIGLDVTKRMIELARAKSENLVGGRVIAPRFLVADMTALPFTTSSVDVVSTGYGLRNVPELSVALAELVRVLKPGGRLLSLDFNRPTSMVLRHAFLAYMTLVGLALGWALHRDSDTYRYIPESIKRYPGAEGITSLLRAVGFAQVRVIPLMLGFMTLHVATDLERAPRAPRPAPGALP